LKFRLWLSVRMGVTPTRLGRMLTCEEFHQMQVMWIKGEFSGV